MAIDGFKDIVDRRGYKVNSEDRKIFEKEIGKSYFGAGISDMIEFMLFDVNDNKLPQGEDGKYVRYIHLNDSNIKDYFIISNNNFRKKLNGAAEFIVDIEKLVREAGYSNGIFKTQVTLLNRRAGSEKGDLDKLWIHEISPSRTEIRVLPLKNKKQPNLDLEKRYEILTEDRQFRDDTIYYAKQYIQNVTTQRVLDSFSRIKGKQTDTEMYHSLIKKEFKIQSIDLFIQQIRDKFIESMNYFIDNKEWNINDLNYGKPKNQLDILELSIERINQIFEQSLTDVIQFYLPKRDIQEDNLLTKEQQVTFDKVKEILKSAVSDNLYESTEPNKIDALVRGCMDPNAQNYNPLAKEEDGSCRYADKVIEPIEIRGCKDSLALNYNPKATIDDGSCQYKSGGGTIKKTQTYYVWSATADIKYKLDGNITNLSGIEYDSFNITHDENSIKWNGDVRLVPKIKVPVAVMVSYKVVNKSTTKQVSGNSNSMIIPYGEKMGMGASGYDSYSMHDWRDTSESDSIIFRGTSLSFQYKDELGNLKTSNSIEVGGSTTICAQLNSLILPPGLVSQQLGQCGEVIPDDIPGCTDRNALNYNSQATIDDGSCTYKKSPISGCMNPKATNYNPSATIDDGSCVYPKPIEVRGCTNPKATNYNSSATIDDGSCVYPQSGGSGGGSGGGGGRGPRGGGSLNDNGNRNPSGDFIDDRSDRLDQNIK